jgi:dienelactone hydrolase
MPRLDVQVPAPDGHSQGTLHLPEGDGPWPGVLLFPDAGGAANTRHWDALRRLYQTHLGDGGA